MLAPEISPNHRESLQEIERLQPQLLYAEAEEAVTVGTAHFDAHCQASIMAPATPFCFWTTQKHLTVKRTMGSVTLAIILSGRKWPAR